MNRGKRKNEPRFADKIENAHKYIIQGHSVTLVLRVLEVERSTYYAHMNKAENKPTNKAGRPAPGYSYTVAGKPVSDEQIAEWMTDSSEYLRLIAL